MLPLVVQIYITVSSIYILPLVVQIYITVSSIYIYVAVSSTDTHNR